MRYRLLAMLMLLLVGSCVRTDEIDQNIGSLVETTINLHMTAPSTSVVGTRSSGYSELTIHRGYIFAFNSSGKCKGYQAITADDVNDDEPQYPEITTTIEGYSPASDKIIAVFNYNANIVVDESGFDGMDKASVSEKFPMDGDYLKELQADFESGKYELGMPMFVNDFDRADGRTVHEVYRALSRIELYVQATDVSTGLVGHSHSFTPENVKYTLVNTAENGAIGFSAREDVAGVVGGATYQSSDKLSFDHVPATYTPTDDITSKPCTSGAIYLYEFPYSTKVITTGDALTQGVYDPKRLSILIKHEDDVAHSGITYYYKLQLLDKLKNEYYDIKRNHDYRVVIKDVYSDGYTDLDEAYLMPPSNIEYEIFDDKGDLTFSNGQYAISMDEVINYESITIYGPETTTLSFDNIRRILPKDVTDPLTDAEIESMTNSVEFDYTVPAPRPEWDSATGAPLDTIRINVVRNDFSGNNKLTDDGKSIKLEVIGEGECTVKLKIKLGNLVMGFDEITINKVGNKDFGGDSSFDAHPGQMRIKSQNFIEGTWNSEDSDFGARNDGDDLIIYMGENATPVGYKTLDGYITAGSATNAYPYFEPKTREGYFSYYDLEDDPGRTKPKKSKIVLNQLAPFYVGHFGSHAESGPHYYNALIAEKIEEIKDNSWEKKETGGVMLWSEATSKIYYVKEKIYGSFLSLEKYLNFAEGRDIAEHIVLNNQTVGSLPLAARYCYMKNDIDGDGVIESNEPIVWFLPAANQMMAMWISKHLIDSEVDSKYYGFNLRNAENPWYWTCSEVAGTPQDIIDRKFEFKVASFNMLEGELNTNREKGGSSISTENSAHVRCVRGIRYDNSK